MTLNYQENNFTFPIILSILAHIFLFMFTPYFAKLYPAKLSKNFKVPDRTLKIERISREDLKKYRKIRTVGVENGAKNTFTMPTKGNNTPIKTKKRKITKAKTSKPPVRKKIEADLKKKSTISKKSTKEQNSLNFSALSPKTNINDYRPKIKSLVSRVSAKDMKRVRLPRVTVQSVQRQRGMKQDLMKQLGPGSPNAQLANKSDMQVHFEPPKGISQDELNSVEKMFYSFQKRTFEGYFNSFITTYNRVIQLRPQLRQTLNSEVHHLTGRVTFDNSGNIIAIKILRWSQDDNLQKLFEETLKEIKSLPNPPKAIIGKDKQFNIYYQLKIN